MRIVDRATFLALPAGTVYAKWTPCVFGSLHIKCDMRGDNDWYCVELGDCPDIGDGNPIDALDRLDEGNEVGVDLNYEYSDGLYDKDQRFAVWDSADVDALIARLQKAKAAAYAAHGVPDSNSYTRDGVRVAQAAFDLNPRNGIDEVMAWYRERRIGDLGGKTPDELVKAGRAGAVLAYIKSLEG